MLGLVIGDNDMVTGFRLVGIEGIEAYSVNEAEKALDNALTRNDLVMILISEEFSLQPKLQNVIDRLRRERVSPIILEVPSSKGKGSEIRISELVRKTLGVRL